MYTFCNVFAQFLYQLRDGSADGGGSSSTSTFQYELVSVSTFDRCYSVADGSVDALEREVEHWVRPYIGQSLHDSFIGGVVRFDRNDEMTMTVAVCTM
eukprot:COSAG06_NODE_2772_length_6304_cov_211.798872_6_plen_98_part_00